MTNSKAATFIGFAIRSGKYRTGINTIETLKRAYVLIVCNTTSDNSKKQIKKVAEKFNCPVYVSKDKRLTEYTHFNNTKVMAITDISLANAFKNSCAEEFEVLN